MDYQCLQDYFIKYNLDYTKIRHQHKQILSTDLSIYTIENKGDKMGIVVTKNNVFVSGSFELFPLFQLLHVKVNISSWNTMSKRKLSEEEIIKGIFKILNNE